METGKTKFLQYFDLFGQRGFVYVKNTEMLRTSTGGCLSITLVLMTIIAFGFYLAQLIARSVVTVSTSTIVDPDVSIQLNSTNFMFAVGFNRSTNTLLNGALDFQLELSDYTRLPNGTQVKKTNITQMIPCPMSYFTNLSGINFEKQYNDYDMGTLFCPNMSDPRSSNLTLAGNFLGSEFRFLKVSVYPCSNATHEKFGLPPCASPENISNTLTSIGRMRFQVYYPTFLVNLYDYHHPTLGNISNQEYLLSPPGGIQIFSNIYLTKQAILTDDNLAYSRSNGTRIVWNIPLSNFRDEYFNYGTNELINVTIRMDINGVTYYRKYMKIPDLMSKVGGLFPLLFAAFGYLAIRYNQYKIKNYIANDIYTVEREKRDGANSRSSSFMDQENPDESYHEASDRKISSFHRIFSRYIDKEKMKSSCWRYLETVLCFWRGKTRTKLYQYFAAEKKLREDLDIISIVKRVNQLEKLKDLLFTREQVELFNYTPEPKLYSNVHDSVIYESENPSYQRKREDYSSIPGLLKIYLAYKKLQNDPNPERKEHNNVIIKMLGADMLKTLEKLDYEIERDPQLIPYLVKIFPEIDEQEVEIARSKTMVNPTTPMSFTSVSIGDPLIHKEKWN